MWNIKVELIDPDNSMEVARGQGVGVVSKGGQLWVVGTQHNVQIMYHRNEHLKPI